jgi:hypothetical protein
MRRVVYARAAAHGRLQRVLEVAQRDHVEYLLVGGYAVGLHGYPRATVDMDIWVRPTPPTLQPRLFADPGSIVRFGTPPLRIEVMTTIDGVEFDACAARADVFELDTCPSR